MQYVACKLQQFEFTEATYAALFEAASGCVSPRLGTPANQVLDKVEELIIPSFVSAIFKLSKHASTVLKEQVLVVCLRDGNDGRRRKSQLTR